MSKHLMVGASLGVAVPLLFNLFKGITVNEEDGSKQLHKKRFVGIQLGGTNYNVAIAEPIINHKGLITDFAVLKRKNGITYADPQQTLREIIKFIEQSQVGSVVVQGKQIEKAIFIGIASFGPLCLDTSSHFYGSITTTPKQKWRGMKILQIISQAFPTAQTKINTDVNAAALGQFKLGKHPVKNSLVYITIGTGVGVGIISQGKPVHGLTHPEGGHIVVERSPEQYQHFKGVCPYHRHQTCLQGMVCNKSIAERLQISFTALADIPDNSKVWRLIAFYLAQLCLNVTLMLSPEVIVIGGGVMNRKLLYDLIRKEFIGMLAGYIQHPLLAKDRIAEYIVHPQLGGDVGVKGAMMLSTID